MTVDEYVRGILAEMPGQLKDVFSAQAIQTALGADISDFMEQGRVKTPSYPRNPEGTQLQVVTAKLLKAATVYNAPGNVSTTKVENKMVTFQWGIDLAVVPYARIHELGGTINHPGGTHYMMVGGRSVFVNKAKGQAMGLPTTKPHPIVMPARPYFAPAMKQFNAKTMPKLVDILFQRLLRGK
jgi:phage gpG-like protein